MLTTDTHWEVKPAFGEDGPFHAVAPDGTEHGPFDTWHEAQARVSKEHELISQREWRERARALVPLLLAMKARGATLVGIEYHGGGDEGDFDGLDVEGAEPTSEEAEQLERYFDDALLKRYSGWENNEGGFGEFKIDLSGEEIAVEHVHNWYVEDYETDRHTDHLVPPVEGEEPVSAAAGS
jgi:hypothetical protein